LSFEDEGRTGSLSAACLVERHTFASAKVNIIAKFERITNSSSCAWGKKTERIAAVQVTDMLSYYIEF